jgi:hypothetical protein
MGTDDEILEIPRRNPSSGIVAAALVLFLLAGIAAAALQIAGGSFG